MQWFFAVTLFVSAGLLFLVQPMFAKMVLPLLGGTPAVWNWCMVFYQAALLAGYVYAHLGARWLGPRLQAAVHLVLMAAPWLVLPVGVAASWNPPADANPIPWLLLLLSVSVGLPFFVVSASAPMLQSWFANTGHRSAKDPYFLYAASNLGSMLGLLAYPFLVEPNLALVQQGWWWAAGYGLLMALTTGCAVFLWHSRGAASAQSAAQGAEQLAITETLEDVPTWRGRERWLALAFVPSSLLLGVTTHISTDLAAVPLLWIVPLALYLLSFVLVFSRLQVFPQRPILRWIVMVGTGFLVADEKTRHRIMVWLQPFLILPLSIVFFQSMSDWFWTAVAVHLVTFFVTAMVCHGELARTRPHASRLTEFYLWMSVGGVLGGLFNALVAPTLLPLIGNELWRFLASLGEGPAAKFFHSVISPNLFYTILEYPLVIAVACMLRPPGASIQASRAKRWLLFGVPSLIVLATGIFVLVLWRKQIPLYHEWAWTVAQHTLRLTPEIVILAMMALVAVVFMARPFWFGMGVAVVLVVGYWFAAPESEVLCMKRSFFGVMRVSVSARTKTHLLAHGSTTHGIQVWDPDPAKRNRPQSYYYPTGPLGQIFYETANAKRRHEIGVIGLGTGSVAGYGRPGQQITFFEIDPEVVGIATDPSLFTYVSDCRAGKPRIVLGDARLSLADEPEGFYDLLVLDAFSSDSIPIHLLTQEALDLYLSRLKDDGVLAVHVSNRYLELEPLVARLAASAGVVCRACSEGSWEITKEERDAGKYASDWVVVVRRPEHLGRLLESPDWEEIDIPPNTPCWTDDFSNIIAVLRK